MIVISSATRIKCTPPKLKNRIMCLDHRKWNILAFRGRLMSLLELRSVGSHRGLSFSRSLAYSICWLRYTDLKHYLVDWNERRRLLGLRLLDPPKTFAGIANGLRWDERQCSPMSLETPECEAHGGSSHARGKRPPAVEINSLSSYPKNTDLRTNIYFALERLLGYSIPLLRRSLHLLRGSIKLTKKTKSKIILLETGTYYIIPIVFYPAFYFPKQNCENNWSIRLSLAVSPMISPKNSHDLVTSIWTISNGMPISNPSIASSNACPACFSN